MVSSLEAARTVDKVAFARGYRRAQFTKSSALRSRTRFDCSRAARATSHGFTSASESSNEQP